METSLPLVLAGRRGQAQRLVALNAAATALGLVPGLGLADAQARFPALRVLPEDPAADGHLLEALADRAERWTPLVALDAPDGLLLDITGCAHLFGGEAALATAIRRHVAGLGFSVRVAVAGTVGCAWALARYGRQAMVAAGAEAALLAPLPLACLRLAGETVAGLAEAGLETVGDLIARPRAPLAARYGAGLLRRLDQALGAVDEPISPRRPVADHLVERRLAEPVSLETQVLGLIECLGDSLGAGLEAEGRGATRLEASLFRVDGVQRRLAVGAGRPLRRGAEIARLFAERLAGAGEDWDAGFGFDLIRLAAVETARLAPEQPDLEAGAGVAAEAAFDLLLDRLGARLGPDRLRRPAAADRHHPERAAALVPAGVTPAGAPPPEQDSRIPARPYRLLARPEPVEAMAEVPDGPPRRFRWRGRLHEVARAEGPERIAPEWWRTGGDGPTRDYFRVETAEGARLWLYRAGLFGQETERPSWYLHGFFL